ncbi:uncharacterized protein [Arachis hypogaea]|uniref:uncharacterized protein n=1 Tax=Arachis hypogaea TaxID=3818 RepID=UPI0011057321|nr:uncharacterized protein LOC114926140 [Arachis hypogaea]
MQAILQWLSVESSCGITIELELLGDTSFRWIATCLAPTMSQDHVQLDSGLICKVVLPMIKTDPSVSIPVLQMESETTESWSFFLSNLRQHVTSQPEILIISNRSQAIRTVLNAPHSGWHPLSAYHAYCIRHMASNFNSRFKSTEGKRKELWLQHCNEGRRYGHMTTNLSECINTVLKGTRNLSVAAIFRATYERLQHLFVRRGREVHAQLQGGHIYSQRLLAAIDKNRESLSMLRVTHCDRRASVFSVEEMELVDGWSQTSYRVRMTERTCDCVLFQSLHYPCRHALAACAAASIEWGHFVDPLYTMASVFKVYEREFPPIPDEKMWPPWYGARLKPNFAMRRKASGRPVSTRIWNEIDAIERAKKRCGLCHGEGHTRHGCPNAPHSDP